MKRALAILASVGITATASLSVVACGKNNTLYDNLMSDINETQGSYDAEGKVLTKSSAAVIYIGAKDNASSQSFEYALSQSFESLAKAKATLSQERKVTTSSKFTLNNVNITNHTFSVAAADVSDLLGSDLIKVQINSQIYEANINENNGQATISFSTDPQNPGPDDGQYDLQLTGYKVEGMNNQNVAANWTTAYYQWLTQPNGDRDIHGIDLNLDPSAKEFGKLSKINKNDPVYGIAGDQQDRLFVNALDYSKYQLALKSITVDKISDYWNNDFFKNLVNNYLKKDLMYQLSANDDPILGKDDNYKARQTKVDNYLTSVKAAKGPLFLIVKNGHVIKIVKGWNRYLDFGRKDNQEIADNYENNLVDWIGEIADIFGQSFQKNNPGLFDIAGATTDIKNWNFLTSDDTGASNWDPKKQKVTD